MHDKQLLALYGLKWNPFQPSLPLEALWMPPAMDSFLFRAESLVREGGFALICGEPGLGKSKCLQILGERLARLDGVVIGVMERPQSSLSDFYREMGAMFGVNLSVSNRYGGFRALRERWRQHIKTTLCRSVLLIDEAQEMSTACLNELRLLGSIQFDSQCLLTTVLCGDTRLPEKFRASALLSLGTRIRLRRMIEPLGREELLDYLDHSLEQAGASHLMSQPLKETLADHACGNLRLLNSMAAELLSIGAQKQAGQLDEKLFIEVFSPQSSSRKSRRREATHV